MDIEFDWGEGNRAKAQKHGLSLGEIEQAMRNGPRVAPDMAHSVAEQRYIAIGRTDAGRHVFVAFCLRGGRVRPISARYMHAREIARHAETARRARDDDG